MTLKEILALFDYSIPAGNGYNVECPAHVDNVASLSIADGKKGFLFKCQAGCDTQKILDSLGLQWSDIFHQNGNGNGSASWRLLRTYYYKHAAGNLAYEVLKWGTSRGKQFTIRWKSPTDGRWVNGSKDEEYYLQPYYDEWRTAKPNTDPKYQRQRFPALPLMLYRWIEPNGALSRLVKLDDYLLLPEGEKDVDRAFQEGFIATTNTGGANRKWTKDYTLTIDGTDIQPRRIVIIPDNDDAGEDRANRIVDSLSKYAKYAEFLIFRFPGQNKKGYDLSDWFDDGHTAAELRALIDAAFQATQGQQAASVNNPPPPPQSPPVSASGSPQPQPVKPVIDISIDDMPKLNAECWAAIEQMNKPPILFTYGSAMIRTRYDWQDDSIILDSVTPDVMRHELSQMAEWRKAHNVITKPPAFLVKDVLASRSIPLPRLNRVVTVPVFAPDGTLQTTPGYNRASGVMYAPPRGYQSLPVPDAVSKDDLENAKDLVDELLRDFPFAFSGGVNADYCNAIALFLLPFVRDMIDGPTPLHLIEASMPGSGKGLLATSLLYPGLGKIAGAPQPRDDDELRKFITSELIAMRPVIFLDNISRTIDSGAFAAALTLETWNDRVLGTSATANVKIRSLWLATANNATLSTEITRRTVRIRLTPDTDKPEEREGFLHEDQIEWIAENRPRLVQAAHIICKWAIQQKLPRPKRKAIGSFERWSRLMASILECAGYKDFLGNYRALQDGSDTERNALSFFAISAYEWMQKEKKDFATNGELLTIASPIDGLEFRGKDDHAREMSFGRWIKSKNEVITEYISEDDDPIEIYRLKILSGIAGKGTNRGKSVSRIELVETVDRR